MVRAQSLPFERPVRIQLAQLVNQHLEPDDLLPQALLHGKQAYRLGLQSPHPAQRQRCLGRLACFVCEMHLEPQLPVQRDA